MAWVLVPCLVALRTEFNRVSPGRDRASDGSIGDQRHALSSSDHNPDESATTPYEDEDNVDEVHAIDIDDTGPWPAANWFDKAVERIRANHAAGRDDRLQNIIRNGRIASRSWGWEWRDYTGANGHYEHAHFSARYTSAQEADTSPWGLIEEDDVTPKEIAQETLTLLGPALAQQLLALRQVGNSVLQGRQADAARDAQIAATLAGMQTALSSLAAASGALTQEQVAALTAQVRQAAQVAGAEAVSVLAEQVASLREHLGDDDQPVQG